MYSVARFFRLSGLVAALVSLATPAQAATEYSLTIAQAGAGGTTGHIRFTSSATRDTATCPYGVVYINLTNDVGKAKVSIALTARSAERLITRLDYSNDGTRCWVDLLEI